MQPVTHPATTLPALESHVEKLQMALALLRFSCELASGQNTISAAKFKGCWGWKKNKTRRLSTWQYGHS